MRRINKNTVQLNAIEDHVRGLFEANLADGLNVPEAALRALRTSVGKVTSSEFARYLSDDTVFMVYGRPALTQKGRELLEAAAATTTTPSDN